MTMTLKKILSVLCAAAFLSSALIPVRTAFAAEDWPVWPRKVAPPAAPAPAPGEEKKKEAAAVLDTGDEAGKKAAAGMSAGTVGKYALGSALIIGGIVAIASGGSSGGH
jgi:hypothetical protein